MRDAHAAGFLAFAERAAVELMGGEQVVWLDRAEREDTNLVAALSWSVSSGDGETAGRMAWALWLYWRLRGRMVVGRRLTEEALRLDMSPGARVLATNAAACMAFAQGDTAAAAAHWRETERLALLDDRPFNRAAGIAGVGLVALMSGDLATAEDRFVAALPLLQDQGVHGDWLASLVHVWLGTVRRAGGDLGAAVESMQVGLDAARRRGDRLTAYVALFSLSQVAAARSEHATARGHLQEGIRLSAETGDLAYLLCFLQELAVVASALGEHHRAAVLLGASDAVRELAGAQVAGYYRPDDALREQATARTREALGEDVHDDTVDAGRTLAVDEAIAYALSG
jgi:tetratricopeptide (TPR) repeat protein